MIRYYISPIIGDGKSPSTAYRPKIADYAGVYVNTIIPSNPDGTPKFTWALVCAQSADFTAVDADTSIKDVFEQFADGATRAEIITFLKSRTVGNITTAKRNRIQNYIVSLGVGLTGVTLSTTLWDVLLRVKNHLETAGKLDDLGNN